MLALKELIRKIDTLEAVITDPLTRFGQLKPGSDSELSPSHDLWQNILNDISQYYEIAQCPEKNSHSNQTTVKQLKPMACYAAYLAALRQPAENDNLAYYFERYDTQGVLVAEFYKYQCEQITRTTDLAAFYSKCKNDIYSLFNNLGKARFLDLMIMMQIIALPNTPITIDHIKVGFKLFKDQLENNHIKSELEALFASGTVITFSSLTTFTDCLEFSLNNPRPHQAPPQNSKNLTK